MSTSPLTVDGLVDLLGSVGVRTLRTPTRTVLALFGTDGGESTLEYQITSDGGWIFIQGQRSEGLPGELYPFLHLAAAAEGTAPVAPRFAVDSGEGRNLVRVGAFAAIPLLGHGLPRQYLADVIAATTSVVLSFLSEMPARAVAIRDAQGTVDDAELHAFFNEA